MLACLLAVLPGCERRPVLVEGMTVRLDVTADYGSDDMPELLRAVFYSKDTRRMVLSDFVSPLGGRIHLPAGEYLYLVYNFDLESTILDNVDSYDNVWAHTSQAPSSISWLFNRLVESALTKEEMIHTRAEGSDDDAGAVVIYEPDALYVAMGEISVPHRSEQDDELVIPVYEKDVLKHGRITVRGLTGIENLSSVTVYITNLSGALYPTKDSLSVEPVVMSMVCEYDGTSDVMVGEFLTFGCLPLDYYTRYDYAITAYILLTDRAGGQYLMTQDLTSQIIESVVATDTLDAEAVYEFEVPEPGQGGGGFSPTLDDWVNEIIPIPLG